MDDNSWVIYNGDTIRADRPVVPVESRGLMYGDGCFETFRAYSGRFFKLEAHLNRLQEATTWLGMNLPEDLCLPDLREKLSGLLERNGLSARDAVIRMQVWRAGRRGYDIDESAASNYSILATPLPDTSKATSLATVEIRRIPAISLPSQFKLCNNINYIAAAAEARAKSLDDALMQTIDGYLSETTIGNLFWVSGQTVFTPSKECDLLPGITRAVLIDLIEGREDLNFKEGRFEPEAIYRAEAVWLTNSVRELQPVKRIDRQAYSTKHSVFHELNSNFQDYLQNNLAVQ